jgi:hypothetical protein
MRLIAPLHLGAALLALISASGRAADEGVGITATVGRSDGDTTVLPVNQLVTPEVEYDTWKEFVDLVYLVQDDFCACIAAAVLLDALL